MIKLERGFEFFADRSKFDKKLNDETGWAQIDTDQDASYYGVWTSPGERAIFSYTEGDTNLETAETDAEYREALVRCLAWHRARNPRYGLIDVKILPVSHPIRDKLVELGLAASLH
jgi:hypothetical protein